MPIEQPESVKILKVAIRNKLSAPTTPNDSNETNTRLYNVIEIGLFALSVSSSIHFCDFRCNLYHFER